MIKHILDDYAALANQGQLENLSTDVIFDEMRDRHMLFKNGWWQDERIRSAIVYVRLHDGKIWIEEDWTEDGIATELLKARVPEEDIVLAFHHPDLRPLTELVVG